MTYLVAARVGQQKQQQQQGGALSMNPVSLVVSTSSAVPPKYRMIRDVNWYRHTARYLDS